MATAQRTNRTIVSELFRAPSMPVLLLISALTIGAAALVPLVVSSVATTTNGHVRDLEQQRGDWQARVQDLELEVATLAGLDRIERAARKKLDMVEPEVTRYIAVPTAPPEPRRIPSRYLPPGPEQREADPGIWEQVMDWLPLP